MSNIQDWKQSNTDIGFVQAGSAGVSRAGVVLGAKSGRPEFFDWESFRWALVTNSPDYIAQFDNFGGAALSTRWGTSLSTGATIATNAQVGGAIRFTTDTDDDDFAILSSGLNYRINNGWTVFSARVKSVTAITLRAIEIGISDATTETGGLAFSNHSTSGVTAVADNALVFGYDTDASMTTWAANTVRAAGTPTATALTGLAPSLTYQNFDILVNNQGDAWFYVDGNLVASKVDAIAPTAVVTLWIALKSLSAATKSIDVDFAGISGLATN